MRQGIFLAILATGLAAPSPSTHKIPYQRRSVTNKDGSINEQALLASLSRTLVKYGHEALPEHVLAKRATGTEPLTDQVDDNEDELYYGSGKVGSQTFTIDFDTGSADLFVPGPSCTSADGCTGSTHYSNSGQDQHNTTTVTYGSGEISGENYKDRVTVAGLTVPSQGFISLTDASGFSGSNAEGLMGMAFQSIAETGYPTFVQNLIAQGSLTQPEFSFYLGRAASGTQTLSELFIGGVDKSKYSGTFKSIPVTTQGYWQVALADVAVNGNSAGPTTAGQAAIDTGTTIVLAPTIAAAAIFALVPGAIPLPLLSGSATITLWAYPCNTAAKYIPKINFGGTNFAINPKDFNLGSLTSSIGLIGLIESSRREHGLSAREAAASYCVAGLGSADIDPTENLYVVGDVFLKNWYTSFSYAGPSVKFAPAVKNNAAA